MASATNRCASKQDWLQIMFSRYNEDTVIKNETLKYNYLKSKNGVIDITGPSPSHFTPHVGGPPPVPPPPRTPPYFKKPIPLIGKGNNGEETELEKETTEKQRRRDWRKRIQAKLKPGFHFNRGFCMGYHRNGMSCQRKKSGTMCRDPSNPGDRPCWHFCVCGKNHPVERCREALKQPGAWAKGGKGKK
eukprot:5450_1